MITTMQNYSSDRTTPLDAAEKDRFLELKAIIRHSFRAVFEAGMALTEIGANGYYIETHDTFEAFVKDEFEMARRTAYKYIDAFISYENLKKTNTTLLPVNENQIRPLTVFKDDPDTQAHVWEQAVATAPDGKVTGKYVAEVVRNYLGLEIAKRTARMKDAVNNTPRIPEKFKDNYFSILDILRDARQSNWKDIDKEKMMHYLDGLRRFLED